MVEDAGDDVDLVRIITGKCKDTAGKKDSSDLKYLPASKIQAIELSWLSDIRSIKYIKY